MLCSAGVQLDSDHPRSGSQQGSRDRTFTGADVEDEIATADRSECDQPLSPLRGELVPTPTGLRRAHGGAP